MMADSINKDKVRIRATSPDTPSLKDIELLIELAKDIQDTIIYSKSQRTRYIEKTIFIIFMTSVLFVALFNISSFRLAPLNTIMDTAIIVSVPVIFVNFMSLPKIKEYNKNIEADLNILTELIDIINSLVESIDAEDERIISLALVKIKLRRLSLSGEGSLSKRNRNSV